MKSLSSPPPLSPPAYEVGHKVQTLNGPAQIRAIKAVEDLTPEDLKELGGTVAELKKLTKDRYIYYVHYYQFPLYEFDPALNSVFEDWVKDNLPQYTGVVKPVPVRKFIKENHISIEKLPNIGKVKYVEQDGAIFFEDIVSIYSPVKGGKKYKKSMKKSNKRRNKSRRYRK